MSEPTPELASTLASTEADRLFEAESFVRSECGWHIAPSRSETVTVDGSGTHTLALRTLHLTDVTAVTEDGETVNLADIEWSEAGFLVRDTFWTRKRRGVTVEITHGYDTVPAEVTGLVKAIAQRAVDNPGARVRTQDGPFSDVFAEGLTDHEKAVLDRYRLPSLP